MRGAALFVALAAVGGCSSTGTTSSVSVTGTALHIYASAPSSAAATDVVDAERLALSQAGGHVGKFRLSFRAMTADTTKQIAANARRAISDKDAIAYLGEVQPGTSSASMGINNAQDLLQISPTDNAIELTRTTSAVPGAPNDYYESRSTYGRTFGRVVPTGLAETRALASEMGKLGVHTLYLAGDGSPYGKAMALAMRQAATGAGIAIGSGSPSGRSAGLFLAASSGSAEARLAASAPGGVKLFAPSAVALDPAGVTGTGLYVSTPGVQVSQASPSPKAFRAQFSSAYGHAPAAQAIFGYAAMQALLRALRRAGGNANNRSDVVHGFFSLRNAPSALGTYSINSSTGDIELAGGAPFVITRLQQGALRPFTVVTAGG